MNVRLARHIGREQRDVALTRRDGEPFPIRPNQNLIHVRLQALLQLVDLYVGLHEVEVVGVGFAERGTRGEIRHKEVKEYRAEDASLRNAGSDDSP